MSSTDNFDALALAKLDEHYVAAGEPEEIDDAFASRYFADLAAASGEEIIPLPGKAVADFLKKSQAFVDVKFETAGLKFGGLESGGRGAVIGNVQPGEKGTFIASHVKKVVLIRIKNHGGKPLEGGVFIGLAWSSIKTQTGTGTWVKL